MSRFRFRARHGFAVLTVLSLVLAACGGDDDDDSQAAADSTTTTRRRTTTTVKPEEAPLAPLTGLPDPTGESFKRSAMTVKIDNRKEGEPQWGVEEADVVYEEIVEGGATRLAAMFNSHAPDQIGPIRSVRNSDAAIVWPVRGIFVYSGGARISVNSISAAPVKQLDETRGGDAMFRDRSRKAPFNLYGIGPKLYEKVPDAEPVPPPALFKYRDADEPAAGEPASSFVTSFKHNLFDVTWTWNATTGTYTRNLRGNDVVAGSGNPIAPANVVVHFVDYQGGAGREGSEAELTGEGEAWVFSGGKLVKGTWQRPNKETPARYLDAAGVDIPLTPGQTWVVLPQIGYPVTVTP